jgi:hypothetical protein
MVSCRHRCEPPLTCRSLIFVSVNTPTKKSGVGAGFAADLK